MQRYIKVCGVAGKLVADPHTNARRYVGARKAARPADAPPFEGNLTDAYESIEQVVVDHRDLRSAIAAGDLKLIAEGRGRNEAEAFPQRERAKKEEK
jgi:hypothetical protein